MKSLFIGLRALLPPLCLPKGRYLEPSDLHLTLSFLGNKDAEATLKILSSFDFKWSGFAPLGICEKILFLGEVAAFDCAIITKQERVNQIKKELDTLFSLTDLKSFIPHITLARKPFDQKQWEKFSQKTPAIFTHLHLYQSLGFSKYAPLFTLDFPLPFEEVHHTADYAYHVYGETFTTLYLHAIYAISYKFPSLFPFAAFKDCSDIDQVIFELNRWISTADITIGSELKAVSYHHDITFDHGIMRWEMILDV